ncbi:MAG: RNA polymerase sigma factor [Myxococcota bacterium]
MRSLGLDVTLEARLLDGCAEGNAFAWRELHRRYYSVAAAFLRKLGVAEGDLEDATQEVFLQVHKYLPRFRRESELSTWLYRLCITQARHVRRRARLTQALRRLLSLEPTERLVSAPPFTEELARSSLERALSALSANERSVFVLYEMDGLSGKQIAEILRCPEATVWRRLHYARRTFRRALGVEEESGGEGSGSRAD